MKKNLALLLVVVMLLLSACGTTQPSNTNATGSTEMITENATDNSTAESTGNSSGTGATDPSTEATDAPNATEATTVPTSKPTEGTAAPEDYTLKLPHQTLSLEAGQVGNLQLTYTGTGTITWSSDKESVATVSNGKVTAKKAGTAVITVTDGVKKASCKITVTEKTPAPVEVKLNLSKTKLDMKVGDTYTLSITYTGSKSLSWSSSNSAIASVSNGKVTAKSAGNAVITVTDGVKSVQCSVTVTNPTAPVVVNLTVSPTSLNLVVGNTSTLTYSYNGTGTLSWSSSDTSVVTVSNGKVTAKGVGSATIKVTDNKLTAECTVVVIAKETASLTIGTKNNTKITVGDSLQLDYTYTGNKPLTWSSNNTSKLTVNQSGVVTGVSVGSTFIKVTDGDITARITIVVEEKDTRPLATSLVETSHNAPIYDGVTKYAGDYMTFKVNVQPDASNPNITVTSDNTSVVSVSWRLNGSDINEVTLNFKSAGTTTVRIKSADGNVEKAYKITVRGGYDCNPGSGTLTPEQFVNCFNGVVKANGMSTSDTPTGYLVLTLSPSELTWSKARKEAEGIFHAWWTIGYRTVVLTYEGIDGNGNHIFYERGY